MNFLILSDSHRRRQNVDRAIKLQRELDAVLFLGDGIDDFEDTTRHKNIPLFCVRGNCDLFSPFSDKEVNEELILHFEEYTVMMMHGHRYGVKTSPSAAIAHAARAGADILLFGHTHEPFERRLDSGEEIGGVTLKKPIYVFNPGSIGQYSFGTLTIRKNGILFGHGYLSFGER